MRVGSRAKGAVRALAAVPALPSWSRGRLTPPIDDVGDRYWYWMHDPGRRLFPQLRNALPGVPSDEIQATFTGSAGRSTLTEGWEFYRLAKAVAAQHATPVGPTTRVLDFGCGWGRILRFFRKEVASSNLVGADPLDAMVGICRDTFDDCTFVRTELLPPSEIEPGFDLVYAFSVFSHLDEEAANLWVAELARLLRPGGLMVVTTRDRGFITDCAALRQRHGYTRDLPGWLIHATAFPDTDAALADYDAGRYCFSARLETYPLPHFGEACIPRSYVERRWSDELDLVDHIDDRSRCAQNVIVCRRRA